VRGPALHRQSTTYDDVALGSGMVEWPKVLREAVRVGVQHFFIEDESPTVLEQIHRVSVISKR
jgi:hypothetical protein